MQIEFTKTKEPYNRIVLNRFSFGDIADFTMERKYMTSSPKAIKQEIVKEVIVLLVLLLEEVTLTVVIRGMI